MEWNRISRESQFHDEANSARNCRPTLWHRPLSAREELQSQPLAGQGGRARGPDSTCRDHWKLEKDALTNFVASWAYRQSKGTMCDARFFHVVPIRDDTVLNGILQLDYTSRKHQQSSSLGAPAADGLKATQNRVSASTSQSIRTWLRRDVTTDHEARSPRSGDSCGRVESAQT